MKNDELDELEMVDEEHVSEEANSEALVTWLTARLSRWEDYRDENYKSRWDEYFRIWRGKYAQKDSLRQSERSKLIHPALSQAIEASVAEVEEAVFGRGRYFTIADDLQDANPEDVELLRNTLEEDFEWAGVKAAISEILLIAAITGTGVGKIVVEDEVQYVTESVITDKGTNLGREFIEKRRKIVRLMPVMPNEFVIDPVARTVDEAMGCAHIMMVPRHSVLEKQQSGVYRDVDITVSVDEVEKASEPHSNNNVDDEDQIKITEYHGLIPKSFLEKEATVEDLEAFLKADQLEEDGDDGLDVSIEMVEAIVTIANDEQLLRKVKNPFWQQDRSIVAFQFDTVPASFWGRGVAEKGYNPQKALDAELRGRIDAMAMTIHPMMAADASRLPRGVQMSVRPGKNILTNGDPREILMPFNFGRVDPNTFHQSGELERMVQMGTGAMDSATPQNVNARNSTVGGMSMVQASAIKRSKRTLANFERNFLIPLIHKAARRYMQFDPDRYPVADLSFKPNGSLGLIAQELEQQNLASLLQTVPPGTPAYWIILESIYENTSLTNKQEMLMAIQQMRQAAANPPPPQPTIEDKIKLEELRIREENMKFDNAVNVERVKIEGARLALEERRIALEETKAEFDATKKQADTILALAKAEAEEIGKQLNTYKSQMELLKEQSLVFKRDEATGALVRDGGAANNPADSGTNA